MLLVVVVNACAACASFGDLCWDVVYVLLVLVRVGFMRIRWQT